MWKKNQSHVGAMLNSFIFRKKLWSRRLFVTPKSHESIFRLCCIFGNILMVNAEAVNMHIQTPPPSHTFVKNLYNLTCKVRPEDWSMSESVASLWRALSSQPCPACLRIMLYRPDRSPDLHCRRGTFLSLPAEILITQIIDSFFSSLLLLLCFLKCEVWIIYNTRD